MLNLTPHAIVLRDLADGKDWVIEPSGSIARVSTTEEFLGVEDQSELPVMRRQFGQVHGLPEEGVPCLVSALVLSAVPGRAGVYAPDTGPTAVRDERGLVVAVTRLVTA